MSEKIGGLLSKARKIFSDFTFFNQQVNQVDTLNTKFISNELIIPLIGEFSSGKSSLLNSILGKSVLPVDILPTTFTINEIRFSSEKDRIEIFYDKEEKKEIKSLINLQEFNCSNASLIKVYSSNSVIPKGIVIVDAPGLSSDIKSHEKILLDYVPQSDAILLAIDVNQGSITKTTENFLNIVNPLNKKIYLIFTKSEQKSSRELDEAKVYAETKYPFKPEGIIFTSAKKNKIDEFVKLIKNIHIHSDEIFTENISKELKRICDEGISLLDMQISSAELDTGEIELKIKEINQVLEKVKYEVRHEIEKTKEGIEKVEEHAVNTFRKRMMGNVNTLVDITFNNKEQLESAFDNAIRSAAESAEKVYQNELEGVVKQLILNIEGIAKTVDVGSLIAIDVVKGIIEGISLGLFLLLPGGPLLDIGEWLLARIAVRLRLPILKELWQPFKELLDGLIKVMTKSFVESKIVSAIENAVQSFKEELRNTSQEIFSQIEREITERFKQSEKSYIDSLESLNEAKKKKESEFNNYITSLKNARKEIELISEELHVFIKTK
jgi:GTPase SAR1 family protein